MSIIGASSVRVATLADGSLRLTLDIEPRDAQAAFALFGAPGRAVALAALKDGSGVVAGFPVTEPDVGNPISEKPKGGEWAKMAGMWCADPDFWVFLNQTYPNDDYVENAEHAAMAVRIYCDIESRAELDHNPAALELFNVKIRRPFQKWMQARGIVK